MSMPAQIVIWRCWSAVGLGWVVAGARGWCTCWMNSEQVLKLNFVSLNHKHRVDPQAAIYEWFSPVFVRYVCMYVCIAFWCSGSDRSRLRFERTELCVQHSLFSDCFESTLFQPPLIMGVQTPGEFCDKWVARRNRFLFSKERKNYPCCFPALALN